ncbi:MAG: GNAT family N-acetyltransferase [Casimicrobium sp.]
MSPTITYSTHDELPNDAARVVDNGIGDFNDAAAALHEVRPLGVFARDASNAVVGGAVGRTWGRACELQQLWVSDSYRDNDIGTTLMKHFESRALTRGCEAFYLETYSFQAPAFYKKLGYRVAYALDAYPHGIERYLMRKQIAKKSSETES